MCHLLQAAETYQGLGYAVIPLIGKRPAIAWKTHQERCATKGELYAWFGKVNGRNKNIGVVCGAVSNLTVVDVDDKEAGRRWFATHRNSIRTITETRRGVHFWFRASVATSKFTHGDIKGEGSYVVAPPSTVDGWHYRFIDAFGLRHADDLEPYNPAWFPQSEKRIASRGVVHDVDKYLATIESAQGQNGSGGLVRACAVLRDCGLHQAEALLKLQEWNRGPTVTPPWSDRELLRALVRIYAKGGVHPQAAR